MSADADAATVKAVVEAMTTKADVADTITKEAAKATERADTSTERAVADTTVRVNTSTERAVADTTVRVNISTADAADISIKPRQGLDKNITTWAIHSETSSL